MTDEELETLLPWYANGTLDGEEAAAVEALLQRSENARRELAFLRALSDQINRETSPAPSELGWQRLRRQLNTPVKTPARRWWKPGLAAAAAIIMALQVMIVTRQPEPYDGQLLGAGSTQVVGHYRVLQVQFDDTTRWDELMAVVQAMHGTIVDGPGSIGLLRIQVPEQDARFATREQLLDWLQQQPGVTHAAFEND